MPINEINIQIPQVNNHCVPTVLEVGISPGSTGPSYIKTGSSKMTGAVLVFFTTVFSLASLIPSTCVRLQKHSDSSPPFILALCNMSKFAVLALGPALPNNVAEASVSGGAGLQEALHTLCSFLGPAEPPWELVQADQLERQGAWSVLSL